MSEPPNKKQKGQDGSGDDHRFDGLETYLEKQVAHTVGKPIVKTTAKPADPSWSRANVAVDDTAHYIPPGFMETAQGYDEYIHLAADLSSHQYEWVEGTTGVTEIGGYVREEFEWVAGQENLDFALWVNEDTKHAFVVYKGTTEGKEWITQNFDAFRGNEGNNPYFSEAYQAYKQCVDNLGPEYTVDVTGHSLGGSKAMYVTRRAEQAVANGVYSKAPHSITFNPGTGPWTKLPSRENNLIIRNAGDPIGSLPEEAANTVTYKNYDTLDAVFNFEHRVNQHGIDAFISNAASNDGGSFVDAAVESGLPDRPRPGYDLPVRDGPIRGGDPGEVGGGDVVSVDYGDVIEVGGDIGGIGDIGDIGVDGLGVGDVIGGADVAGVAGRAAEEAAATGLAALTAEIMESVVMSEFDMLMMFDMTGQGMSGGGGLGDYIADSIAWDASGYGDVKDLNHYAPSMYDKSFGKAFEPKATAENARRGVIKQVHDFYQHPLQYNEHLFKDRADYKKYQTDFILNSLPAALKGSVDLPDGAQPLPNWAMSFNRVLKGYAKEVARDEEYMKTKSNYDWYSGTGKFSSGFLGTSLSVQDMGLLLAQQAQIVQQTLGYQDDYHRRTADLFDQDGMKAVMSAVARQEYIDKANSQQWYNNDKPAVLSYSDSYDTMVKRRKEDYIKNHPELQKIIDDYEQNGIIPHSFGPDFKYPEQSFENDTPPDWWIPPYMRPPAGEDDADKNSAPVNKPGMTEMNIFDPDFEFPPAYDGDWNNIPNLPSRYPPSGEVPNNYPNWNRAIEDLDPMKPLAPANGGQGKPDTPAPSVPGRNEQDVHPGQPGYDPDNTRDGLPDGENHDPNEPHDGVTHDNYYDEYYMNHDVNNHMQAPSEGMSTSQYTQALSRFTNNAFGNLGTMRSKGMNFTRFVELSDINGSMAEHARDMLAD
jgi:hypothetical protein